MEDYKVGGYHPVHIGEIYLNRYMVIQKLGWGHFSTVWLSKDLKFNTFVALKIQKSSQHYLDAAYDEVEILQELDKHNYEEAWVNSVRDYWNDQPEKTKNGITMNHSQVVQLLNSFIHHGPNGRHFCMVFEIMGVTLLEIIKRYNYTGIPLPYVRIMAKEILIGLDFLHRMCNIIHTDLKPENVLLCLTEKEIKEIATNGYLDVKKKKKNAKDNDTTKNKDKDCDDSDDDSKLTGMTGNDPKDIDGMKKKKKGERKKRQKMKKKLAKQLEKKGLNEDEIRDELDKVNKKMKEDQHHKRKASMDSMIEANSSFRKKSGKYSNNESINFDEYELADLVEKPRMQSVPRYSYDETTEETHLEFDIKEYSYKLQSFAKEKARILHDEEYKKDLIVRKKQLESIKDDNEKAEILLKTNNDKGKRRGPGLDENVNVKIVDMGNACWFHHHFSTEIQTRQYRGPEVILGINYGASSDIWSFACMIFELVTGDFLFEPRKGDTYSKNDDHLAQIIELLGKMPTKFAVSGRYSKKYFTKNGSLRRIKGLQYWPLKSVLMEKYRFKEEEADGFTNFLLPMLSYEPEHRATAQEILKNDWLKMEPNFDYKMSDREYEKLTMFKKNVKSERKNVQDRDIIESDTELNQGDDEDNDELEMNNEENEESDFLEPTDNIEIQNFNNSFAIYGQHVKLSALDKPNPQFNK
mmetsp:Transcript_5715/g.5892  ORF Transcript_5715/g.5892 Transcript_5715/m.5892 type:complete len:694 (-) Transcript_5715:65-2146(-)